ncbi:MAG: hypothetical protein Q8R86_09675 [Sulfuricurvum sp.]|nr:hypothetical protein [Sulfuricurvum sp.]
MPLPLLLAPLAGTIVARLAQIAIIDRIGLGAAGALGTYLGYEKLTENLSNPFGSAPSGLKNVPVSLPTKRPAPAVTSPAMAPSVPTTKSIAPVMAPSLDYYGKSQVREKEGTKTLADAFIAGGTAVKARNDALAESAGASRFLTNQVEAKASLDEVSFAVNAQTMVQAMIYETLERNLSLIATAITAGIQVANVGAEQTAVNARAMEKVSDRLEPFADNQIHRRTVTAPLSLETVLGQTAVSPRDAALAKDFALAREKADVNSIGATHAREIEDVVMGSDFDVMKFLKYIKVTDHLEHCVPDANGNYPEFDWSVLNG